MVTPSVGLGIATAKRDGGFRRPLPAMAVGELSDHYTCVFSSVGDNRPVSKMVNFVDGDSGVFFELSPTPMGLPLPAADFLSCCYLCKKKLQGIDIFMYREEKAFCSVECRYQQILSDEEKH